MIAPYNLMKKKAVLQHILGTSKTVSKIYIMPHAPFFIYVKRLGVGYINTKHGGFWLYKFYISDKWKTYFVLLKGHIKSNFQPDFKIGNPLNIRIDSGCVSGQLFNDITCECKQQLEKSMREINEGIIIHIPSQDGRGMGTEFKLKTLTLQEILHLDTVQSAQIVNRGNKNIDIRTYDGAVAILRFFGYEKGAALNIKTNNPKKITPLIKAGYIVNRHSIVIKPTKYTMKHLVAKQKNMGHLNLI